MSRVWNLICERISCTIKYAKEDLHRTKKMKFLIGLSKIVSEYYKKSKHKAKFIICHFQNILGNDLLAKNQYKYLWFSNCNLWMNIKKLESLCIVQFQIPRYQYISLHIQWKYSSHSYCRHSTIPSIHYTYEAGINLCIIYQRHPFFSLWGFKSDDLLHISMVHS